MDRHSALQRSLQNEAHVWLTVIDKHNTSKLVEVYETLLSDDERQRYRRYYFNRHRASFLVNHALLRTTLSRYSSTSPAEWIFSHNSRGRPEIHKPRLSPSLRFNISRTEYAAVCLVASSIDCGIDIECPAKLDDIELLSRSVLSPHELASIQGLSDDVLKERFLVYWTLKESYVKALGIGLSEPLPDISFQIGPDNNAELVYAPQISSRPSDWQFTTIKLPNEHIMSVALRMENHAALNVRVHVVDPGLSSYSSFHILENRLI